MKRAFLFSSLLGVFTSVSLLAQASVTLSPSSYNFGSTAVDTGTAWVTFTLSNTGSSAVSISNVTVSGPFVVSSNCGSSVAANGSCPIYVYFYPTSAGAASGTLTVTDNATNSPQTSSLSGTGGSGGRCTTTNWFGRVWHNQLRHKPELDSGHSSRKLHDQQLHRVAEWNLDWNRNRHILCRQRTCGIDRL
jgi:hypothetical protein